MGSLSRELVWEGCFNVRDLGGLPTAAGGETRYGSVVRADNVRRLTAAGWEAAIAHGVRHVVDLRFPGEAPDEPAAHELVAIAEVSLLGTHDPELERAYDRMMRDADDVPAAFTRSYVRALQANRDRIAAALTAVAEPDDGAVLIHCFAGKDRTGIVAALLLTLAEVPDELVAVDYAASEPNVARLLADWVATAADEDERRTRSRLIQSPHDAMLQTLAWLEDAGGVESYLRAAGLSAAQVDRLRDRLV